MINNFSDKMVLDVIEKGLNSLGESPKKAIWFCLEKDFGFDRQKVPENLEAFQQTLQKFFGLGYFFLDALFRNYLAAATGEELGNYSSFAQTVHFLRKKNNQDLPTSDIQVDATVAIQLLDQK